MILEMLCKCKRDAVALFKTLAQERSPVLLMLTNKWLWLLLLSLLLSLLLLFWCCLAVIRFFYVLFLHVFAPRHKTDIVGEIIPGLSNMLRKKR